MSLTIGSLFSGIGGLELGLERAGLGPVLWQVEKEPYCREVLARHWPSAQRFDDVRSVGERNLQRVDLICGGFPCQDISFAGYGAGLSGERSGLWFEYARIVRELRPRYVVVENVAALIVRGLDAVLGTLATLGYDAEWSTLSACAMGAPHMRRRLFIVAHADGEHGRAGVWDSIARGVGEIQTIDGFARARTRYATRLENPSELYRGADGIPRRLERNRAIGNAVVPDCAEFIGRMIMNARKEAA